jgi:hypothetical protein
VGALAEVEEERRHVMVFPKWLKVVTGAVVVGGGGYGAYELAKSRGWIGAPDALPGPIATPPLPAGAPPPHPVVVPLVIVHRDHPRRAGTTYVTQEGGGHYRVTWRVRPDRVTADRIAMVAVAPRGHAVPAVHAATRSPGFARHAVDLPAGPASLGTPASPSAPPGQAAPALDAAKLLAPVARAAKALPTGGLPPGLPAAAGSTLDALSGALGVFDGNSSAPSAGKPAKAPASGGAADPTPWVPELPPLPPGSPAIPGATRGPQEKPTRSADPNAPDVPDDPDDKPVDVPEDTPPPGDEDA